MLSDSSETAYQLCGFYYNIKVALQKIFLNAQLIYDRQNTSCASEKEEENSLFSFLIEVIEVFDIELNTLIYAFILLSKLSQNKREILISQSNIYLITYISIIVSTKMLQDESFIEEELGNFIGITSKELSLLEAQFLEALKYDVFVNEDLFKMYKNIIILKF